MRPIDQRAEAVREFNRFYTRRIGALGDAHLGSPFSLSEMRVLYELAHRDAPTASEIGDALGLDRGYLSRTLRAFKRRGMITTTPGEDRRRAHLALTAAGKRAFLPIQKHAHEAVVAMLEPLAGDEQRRVLDAMRTLRIAFGDPDLPRPAEPFILRSHRPGDMGWVVYRHAVLYADQFGYDERFEALIAQVVAGFIQNFKPGRERCWIAERNGEIVGTIFVVEKSKTISQLRLLLVEPAARGLGLGQRLVQEVVDFSRRAGYKRVRLWTQSELTSARKIYKAAGFQIVGKEGHESFGKPLEAEVWELEL
jgi:DNA-binding MarR family transcriptional regulator/GNAT superfamily N-acetyltransferase